MAAISPVPVVPFRTPMYNSDGDMSRIWIKFFEGTGTQAVAGSNGLLILSVPGTLGILSSAAPLVELFADAAPTDITALVKQAPVGGNLVINLVVAAVTLGTVTILAGALSGTVSVSGSIAAGALVTLDITGVGLTFPGADLTALVRF